MPQKILELHNVSKIYGNLKALADINLSVNAGDWLSIMGPSGSGKTTMINIIGCMDTPSTGSVILDGSDISFAQRVSLNVLSRAINFQPALLPVTIAVFIAIMLKGE